MKRIGVIGCGLMGSGIVTTLLRENYEVHVYDIDQLAVEKLIKEGAQGSKDIQDLARQVKIMILSLPSPDLIEHILLDGREGALQLMQEGSYILDMSTNDVRLTRELYKQSQVHGIHFLDCPLSGGPDGAREGKLTIMVGGSQEAFNKVSPLLEVLGEEIQYIGASGSGQVVKLCNNMLVGGIIALLSEVFLTGESAGVSRETVKNILQKGSGATRVMEVFGGNLIDNTFDQVIFSLNHLRKDIDLYQSLAEDGQIPTLSSQSIQQLYDIAHMLDHGNKDSTGVYKVFQKLIN